MKQERTEDDMETSWIETSYQTLEFFFWEPQHIARQKNPDSVYDTVEKVRTHIRGMEVTLNHQINTFLLLAPYSLRPRLFDLIFKCGPSGKHHMHGGAAGEEIELPDSVQPDFFFVSKTSAVSLEMKINAKSSLDQFLKYLFLGLSYEITTGHQKDHFLGFIGRDTFPSLWKAGYKDASELKSAAAQMDLGSFLRNLDSDFEVHLPRFREILTSVDVGFINYPQLAGFLMKSQPPPTDRSDGAEVYQKLIRGLVDDLQRRELA